MTALRTAEVRTITIAVTDVPDLPNYRGDVSLVPATVEITYRWHHPNGRPGWLGAGYSIVVVNGPRRLKSGKPGNASMSVDFGNHYSNLRPQWLIDLVAEYMPEGWDL